MADVNANINVDINSSAALAGLKRLEQQIESFQRSVTGSNAAAAAQQTSLNRALIQGINNTGLFTAKQISAVDSVGKFTNSLEKNRLSLGEYTKFAGSQLPGLSRVFKREFDTMQAVATDRVKAINTQYLALGRTVDGVTSAIKSTPTGLSKGYATDLAVATARQQMFNKLIDDGSTKLLNWGKNTQWAGRQLMVGLSLPLAAFGAAAAAAFMELDKATVQLKRVYGDLDTTTAEVERNTEAVKVLGSEYTKYGISVAETIGISARAAATGATNETLMAATEQTLRFATLGQIDYNQALDTTISLQTAFGVTNDELAQKIDFLNAVENQTILTIEDMSLAIPRVATVVKGLGGDVEDLAVMMTAMREGGVSAENAANGLKSGLASLINPTKRAREQMAKMGLDMQGIINANKGDLMGLINEFGTAIGGLDDFSRQQTLEQVFGKYQFARMSALFTNITKSSGQAARAMDLAAMSAEDLGKIAEGELSVISESTTVKFQAAFEQLKLAIAPIGEAFLKVATPAIEMVTKIANAFSELPEPIKNAIGMATIAIAGIGPVLLMGIGLMGNLIANVIKGIQQFRKLGARIRGDSSAFQYMAKAELEALAASEALEANTMSLTGKLHLQAGAVNALTKEYGRFATAAGIASGAMVALPAGRAAAAGKGKPRLAMARGGVVPGSGSGDKIPALLEPGETVVTKKASQSFGPVLAAMNAGELPGYQGGLNLPGVKVPSALGFASGSRTTQAMENFFKSIEGMSGASEAATKILNDFATQGEKVTKSGFIEEMSKAGFAAGKLRSAEGGTAAAHLTGMKQGQLTGGGLEFLSSARGQKAGSKSLPAQRILDALERSPELEQFIKQYSGLTAELPKKMNRQLTAIVGSGKGVSVDDFMREFVKEGQSLAPSLEKFGAFIPQTAEETKLLGKFEKELATKVEAKAKAVNDGLVVDSILEEETKQLIADYKKGSSAQRKLATAAEKAATTVAQVSLDMATKEGQQFIADNPNLFVTETGKDKNTGKQTKNTYLVGPGGERGAFVRREDSDGKNARPGERVGALARRGGSFIAQSAVGAARKVMKSKSPSEEFADVMDDAAKGMLVGAQRSKKIADKAGRVVGQSAKQAYDQEMSQLRRDIRNDDALVAAGITNPVQRTRMLDKQRESMGRAKRVEEGKRRKEQAQMNAKLAADEKKEAAKRQAQTAAAEKKAEKRRSRRSSVGRGIGRAGGVIGMASMIPFMAQDSEGKFAGMDANTLGMGMMGASMLGPLMGGVKAGAVGLAGVMGVSTAALAGVVAPVAAIGVAAVLLKKGLDNTMAAGKEYADAMTTNAQEQADFAKSFGNTTLAEKRKQREAKKITGLSAREQSVGREFVASEQGQQMQTEAKKVLEQNASGFARNLATQLSQSVISGAMGVKQAKSVAVAMAEALGREDLTANITAQIDKILAPNGDDVTNSPLKIAAVIQANIESDEEQLRRDADRAAQNFGDSFTDNILGLGFLYSGEYDEMVKSEVAFYEAVLANTQSILSTYDDQIMKQEDVVAEIDKKIKAEKDATKKEELEVEKRVAVRQLADLKQKKIDEGKSRREIDYQALLGKEEGRQQRVTSAGRSVEAAGIGNAQALLTGYNAFEGGALGEVTRGGIMGKYLAQSGGDIIETLEQEKEFEIQFLVDLQSGRLDPMSLQILQRAEEEKAGTAANVIETIVSLQVEGDLETANEINTLAAGLKDSPEVLTVFNTKIDGKKPEEIIAYGEVLNEISELPPDIYKSVAIELGDMPIGQLQEFRDQIEQLQGMEIDVVSLLSTGGVKGIQAAANATDSFAGSLKKYAKEIKSINKAATKEQKLERVVSVVTKVVDAEGVEVTPKQIKDQIPKIAAEAGITESEVMVLPPAELVKVISASIMADDLKKAGQNLVFAGTEMGSPALVKEGKAMIAAASAMMTGAGAAAAGGGYGGGGGKGGDGTDEEEENGGGGGEENPFKTLKENIIEQVRTFVDINAKMNELFKGKNTFFNLLKKNQGVEGQIAKLGLSGPLADQIRGMNSADAKKVLSKISQGGKLNAEGERINRAATLGSVAQRTNEARLSLQGTTAQGAALADLQRRGASAEAMGVIAGDPEQAQVYIGLLKEVRNAKKAADKENTGSAQKEWNRAKKALDAYINDLGRAETLAAGMASRLSAVQRERQIADTGRLVGAAKTSGASQETVDEIMNNPELAAEYELERTERNRARKELQAAKKKFGRNSPQAKAAKAAYDQQQKEFDNFPLTIQARIEMEPVTPEEQMEKAYNDLMQPLEKGEAYFQMMFADIEQSYKPRIEGSEKVIAGINKQVQAIEDEIRAIEELNTSDQRRIRGLERQKEMLGRQIEQYERANEADQRRADAINRQSELIQRQIGLVNRQNELDERRSQALQRQQEMMQRQVDAINDEIQVAERLNELDDRSIETLSREDEMRGRISESINRELEMMGRKEEQIRAAYDERISQLDEIEASQQRINQQGQDQLNIAQALSQGDIYAAAAAAQQMRQNQVDSARQNTRASLEQGMTNQVGGLRTSGGLTREQAEGQVQTIEDQSYQVQLAIRDVQDSVYLRTQSLIPLKDQVYAIDQNIKLVGDQMLVIQDAIYNRNLETIPLLDEIYNLEQSTLVIQDAIYNRNLETIPLKDQQRNLDDQIRVINDQIYGRETEILGIQDSRLAPLQKSLTAETRKLDTLKEQMQTEKDSVTFQGMTYSQLNDTIQTLSGMYGYQKALLTSANKNSTAAANVADNWARAARNIAEANRVAASLSQNANTTASNMSQVDPDRTTGLVDPKKAAEAKANAAAWLSKEVARIEAERQSAISGIRSDAKDYQLSQFATGGQVRSGMVSGDGSRDSVLAKLTPGEFVVRKAMVNKYGLSMLTDLNNGSFELPKYSVTKPVTMEADESKRGVAESSPSVYNTYSVNVNVPNANINADEVANKVLYKIRSIDAGAVRGYRGF